MHSGTVGHVLIKNKERIHLFVYLLIERDHLFTVNIHRPELRPDYFRRILCAQLLSRTKRTRCGRHHLAPRGGNGQG